MLSERLATIDLSYWYDNSKRNFVITYLGCGETELRYLSGSSVSRGAQSCSA